MCHISCNCACAATVQLQTDKLGLVGANAADLIQKSQQAASGGIQAKGERNLVISNVLGQDHFRLVYFINYFKNLTVSLITKSKCTHLDLCQPSICNHALFWTSNTCFLCCSVSDKQTCGQWPNKTSHSLLVQMQELLFGCQDSQSGSTIKHESDIQHDRVQNSWPLWRGPHARTSEPFAPSSLAAAVRARFRPSPRCWKHTGGWIQRLLESSVLSFLSCEYHFYGFVGH